MTYDDYVSALVSSFASHVAAISKSKLDEWPVKLLDTSNIYATCVF